MWFYLALTAALISAVSVILNKKILKGVSPLVLTWCTLALSTPIIAIFAFREGIPNLNIFFFIGVVGSVLFYTVSQIIQFRAMKIADLSAIYPLVSLGPLITLLVAFFPPLNEKPSPIAIVGVMVTLLGTYILNVSNARESLFKPIKLLFENKASLLMIISVVVSSAVIVFDKLAINNTLPKDTTFVLFIENILVVLGLLPVIYFRQKNFTREIFDNKNLFIIIGVLNALSTMLAFAVTGGGSVGIFSAILKTQLLFVLLFSFIFFKDKPKFETIAGSLIMILGVVLIKIGL